MKTKTMIKLLGLINPTKLKIINLIEKKTMTISEVNKELSEFSYRTIWQHIQTLEKANMISIKKEEHKSEKPVYVKLKP